jgi:Flp pilus assembly protein TadG
MKLRKTTKGHSIIELACVAVFMVVMALLSANIGIVALGASVNDRACRDAARSAAQGSNSTQALALAQAALAAHPADGYFVTQSTLVTADFVYQDYGGSPPTDTSPYVSVTTTNKVRIPAPILFLGCQFGPGGTLTFSRTYTFPIVKTTLYLN